MTDLFPTMEVDEARADRPLPDRLRPRSLDEIVGQDHLVGAGAPLRKMIDSGRMASMILWGPPGCGKTTLIKRIADSVSYPVNGFFTAEIRRGGNRVGFEVESFAGEKAVLSHVDIRSKNRVGKYGVDVESFERIALPEIESAIDRKNLLIIDEIGKMELYSARFKELILDAFNGNIPIMATILYKPHPFCDRLKRRENVNILQLRRDNFESSMEEISQRL